MEEDFGGVTDSPKRGPTLSTSTSSFEPFDAHDPNLSRLATKMFQKTGEYITHELSTTVEDYKLIENMNKAMMGKVSEMRQMSDSIAAKNNELNRNYEELKPLLQKIDDIESTVDKLEAAAYQLDAYTIRLENKFKTLKSKK
ncbi:biogenesis of lysosome-related organelles complex 1 subunit 2 [Toxorhynchites rutilus septentrionalis]|uniref:biogenesis of lysosome-related organelles complex 1 subunit 2 n=1 Tax=Toxorhynchites rutilus septentrionalis TaxID=329112 RepID=UPI00247AED72|nr:biogenesis of lysosome-related organelles complex 1 subunit 2 [Toxorhynchites rutilus septentrionalis]